MNENLPHWLAVRLAQPLPGPMVGSRFEPYPQAGRRYDLPLPNALPAAVLLLLYPHGDQWRLPLTLRPPHMVAHAGQVSLPGGAVEPGETSAQAALRELHEELGDDGQPIDLLGSLSPLYVRASNYLIAPWVAATGARPRFTPNPAEVEEVLEMPLSHLFDPAHFGSHTRQHEGQTYVAPHFLVGPHHVWGATCMILGELATVLQEI